MPLTASVAIFNAPLESFQLDILRIPGLQPQEILVRNEYVTLCRSDLLTYSGKRTEKTPTLLGHEIVGRIDAMAEDAPQSDLLGQKLKVGDRVTWAIFASDPKSPMAQAGLPQKADDLFKYGHEAITPESHLHGGLSEYIILRKHTPIIKLDESIPLPVVTIINCAVATVAGALRLAEDLNGKNVLISGTGMLGIIACAMAKAKGAANVIALDINPQRLELTRQFGADYTLILPTEPQHLSAVAAEQLGNLPIHTMVDFSGAPDAVENGLELLAIGGTAIWIGSTYPQRNVQINAEKVVRKILTIKGLHNYNSQDLISAVNFIQKHHTVYPLEQLVQGGFTLDQVDAAFQFAIENNPFRVGITL